MQREGLVRREADPRDGRGTVIAPTAAGLRRMAGVRDARREAYGEILATWSPADGADLAAMLGRLTDARDSRFKK